MRVYSLTKFSQVLTTQLFYVHVAEFLLQSGCFTRCLLVPSQGKARHHTVSKFHVYKARHIGLIKISNGTFGHIEHYIFILPQDPHNALPTFYKVILFVYEMKFSTTISLASLKVRLKTKQLRLPLVSIWSRSKVMKV